MRHSVSPSVLYRPDIDGIRGVCVLAVILYHAKVPGFAGGYVGVDAFFVISGYLITRILLDGEAGVMSRLKDFYARRARRILPALFATLALTGIVASILYLPGDLRTLGRDLALAAAMLGNVGAWLDGNYFDAGPRFTPLRHLWSIAVEEQFYLGYPILLALLRARRATLLLGLTLASLALSVWATTHRPIANYFWLPTRAWELLTGALVAVRVLRAPRHPVAREWLSAAGLGVLLFAVYAYTPFLAYPGWYALAPTLATAALIATSEDQPTIIARLLSWRPIVFTGLISYSLYLLHAPLLAFYAYYVVHPPRPSAQIALLLILYAAAILSWRYVELPIRTRRLVPSNVVLAKITLASCASLVALGAAFRFSPGFPGRFPPAVTALSNLESRDNGAEGCFRPSMDHTVSADLCIYGPRDDHAPTALVWGDSHAAMLTQDYERLANSLGVRIYIGTAGACWPLPGAESGPRTNFWHVRCQKFNISMQRIFEHLRPNVLVLNAYWLDRDAATSRTDDSGLATQDAAIEQSLRRLVAQGRAQHSSLCAVLTAPSYPVPVPYALAMSARRGVNADELLTVTHSDAVKQFDEVERHLRAAGARGEIEIIDLKDILCADGRCRLQDSEGVPLYRDANHLSSAGAKYVAPMLESCFASLGRHARSAP